ncbi:hypothetical protein PQX77_015304 [Marasmius sp. AFHP31]|nr:hypothetical protein PQX77_015304 [Marasmius sp. AFHP31]
MSSTRTEMKIETKTETQKGKGQVAPGGDEPPHPGMPPDDPGGSDGEQGSDNGRGSDSWRSASVKEPPSFKERGRKPDVFTGKREEVEDFLMEFGRYLRLNEAIYPRDLADIDEFNKAFNELAGDSEHNDASLKLFYKQGINPALKATINKFEVISTTLEGWQKAAVQKYNDWKKALTSAASTSGNRRQTTTQNIRAATASALTAGPTPDSPASTMPTTTDDAISVAARALATLTLEQHAALASVFSKKDF